MQKDNVTGLLFLLAIVGIAMIGQCEEILSHVPQPKVDERVELLGIICRLAGIPAYQCIAFKEYDDAINQHFAPFKNHPAIRSLRSGGSLDAFMSYAVHIAIENGRVVFPDEDSKKTLEKLHWRDRETAPSVAKHLDDFYVKSRFREFFEAHREMYQKTEEEIKAITNKIDYSWFKRFYGDANLEHFYITPNCIDEVRGYGVRCHFKDGHEELFAIIGASGANLPNREDTYINLIVHEFSHSFCDPLVEKYFDHLKPAAERILPFVADKLTSLGYYPTPEVILHEHLVRACEIRYLMGRAKEEDIYQRIRAHRNHGYLWMAELVEWLGRYENERDKYPTLDDFMPEIVKLQNTLVTDEYIANLQWQEENRPQIAVTNPPNGAKDVDPNITEISITFDRLMMSTSAWCTRDGGTTFPEWSDTKIPVWSEDKRTCTIQNVVLEPGRTYNIWLNSGKVMNSDWWGDGFISIDDISLKPMCYTFTMKEKTE